MRIAYLDCSSGISGDMFLGALLDVGISSELLVPILEALNLHAKLSVAEVVRGGIRATKADVTIADTTDHYQPGLSHVVGFAREEAPPDTSPILNSSGSCNRDRSGIGAGELNEMIHRLPIGVNAKKYSVAILRTLLEAESRVHGQEPARSRYHPIGIADALADIVCAGVGIDILSIDEWLCSPLNLGGGRIECSRGSFSIPGPVVLELLKGARVYSSDAQAELVTPTGAAIISCLVRDFGPFPRMKVIKVGYGAGSKEFPHHANVCQLVVGEAE